MMKEGWEYKKLGDCFPFIKNGANIKQIKNADGLPITRIETLSGGFFNRDRMGYAGIYDLGKYKDYVLEDGDLLMSHINSKTYIGRTVEYKKIENETIIHGMNLLRLKSNKSLINSSFMAYYTLSAEFKANVAKIRKDAVNQSSMAISDLKNILIPLPPLSTQQSIVAELDEINNLLNLKKKELETYDKLSQSLFYEMFGDPMENEKGWEVKKLGEICEEKKNIQRATKKYSLNDEIKYIDISSIDNKTQSIIGFNNYIMNNAPSRAQQCVQYGDILVSTVRPNLKNISIVKSKENNIVASSGFCVLRPINIERNYLFNILIGERYTQYLTRLTTGANYPAIKDTDILESKIPLPPLSLQQTFAERIEAIEEQKANVKAAIEKLETLLASRMQFWFE